MTDERIRIPPAYTANCEYCGDPLDTRQPGIHQWVSGWVKQRDGGGGHGISLPERVNRFAHGTCVADAVAGRLDQPTLFAP